MQHIRDYTKLQEGATHTTAPWFQVKTPGGSELWPLPFVTRTIILRVPTGHHRVHNLLYTYKYMSKYETYACFV